MNTITKYQYYIFITYVLSNIIITKNDTKILQQSPIKILQQSPIKFKNDKKNTMKKLITTTKQMKTDKHKENR